MLRRASPLVGVEIVQHQPDHGGLRIRFHQPLHLLSEVHRSVAPGHLDMSPSALRFTEHEQVPGPVSLVLGVKTFHPSGGSLDGRPHIIRQLLGTLVNKSPGHTLLQHVLHPGHELPAWGCTIPSSSTAWFVFLSRRTAKESPGELQLHHPPADGASSSVSWHRCTRRQPGGSAIQHAPGPPWRSVQLEPSPRSNSGSTH